MVRAQPPYLLNITPNDPEPHPRARIPASQDPYTPGALPRADAGPYTAQTSTKSNPRDHRDTENAGSPQRPY